MLPRLKTMLGLPPADRERIHEVQWRVDFAQNQHRRAIRMVDELEKAEQGLLFGGPGPLVKERQAREQNLQASQYILSAAFAEHRRVLLEVSQKNGMQLVPPPCQENEDGQGKKRAAEDDGSGASGDAQRPAQTRPRSG